MTVLIETPYSEQTANGVSTVFGYPFTVLSADDLKVYDNGVLVPTSSYTVSGIGVEGGGAVTFGVAPLNGHTILLTREIALERETDYQYNGPLREVVIDIDFDRLWQALQGIGARLGGALRAPYPEQFSELPSAANRANKVLAFDATGAPVLSVPLSGTAAAFALLLADSVNSGNGDALVAVKRLFTGAVSETVHSWMEKQEILITSAGAVADNVTDNSTAINVALSAARVIGNTCCVVIPETPLPFFFASTLVANKVCLKGRGLGSKLRAANTNFKRIVTDGESRLESFFLDGGWDGITTGLSGHSIVVEATSPAFPYYCHIDDVRILNSRQNAAYVERGGYASFRRCRINAYGAHGIEFYGVDFTNAPTTTVLDGSTIISDGPNGRAVKITNGVNITLDGVISENTGGYEIAGLSNRNISINRCYQEGTIGTEFATLTGSGIGLWMEGNYGTGFRVTPNSNWDRVVMGGSNTFDLAAGVVPAGWKMLRGTNLTEVVGIETTTSTTGGVNFTACQFNLPPGIWNIQATLQTINSSGATLVNAGFRITSNPANNVVGTTGAGFVSDEVIVPPYSSANAASRASLTVVYENSSGATQTIYMRGFINISAGTIAYKGFMRAVRTG